MQLIEAWILSDIRKFLHFIFILCKALLILCCSNIFIFRKGGRVYPELYKCNSRESTFVESASMESIYLLKIISLTHQVLGGIRTQTLRHWSRVSVPLRHRPPQNWGFANGKIIGKENADCKGIQGNIYGFWGDINSKMFSPWNLPTYFGNLIKFQKIFIYFIKNFMNHTKVSHQV